VNYKLLLVGAILAGNGGFVLFVIPRILTTGDAALMSGTLIALLIIFLIGMTLAGLAILPLILRLFVRFFRIFGKRIAPVYKIFIFRYARRNSSTIITFAFTFSFIIFISSIFSFLSNESVVSAHLEYGADLVIETQGWYDKEEIEALSLFGGGGDFLSISQENGFNINPNRILTSDFEEELLEMEGIERVSTVIASPFHLTQIYSEEGQEFAAEIGDYAGLITQEITLIGIDEQYPSTIKTQYVEFTQGNIISSFEQLFSSPDGYTCVISEGLSVSLDMHLGDVIRISIQRGYENEVYTFEIVGVAAAMPGFFSEFGRSSASANMGGVMISQELYMTLMDIPPIPYLDKIFVKLNLYSQGLAQHIIDKVKVNDIDFDFDVINLEQRITQQQLLFSVINVFFSITLDATIIICLFGLLSSSYSTIIERKKEIGIIRTLGLKG